MNGRPLNDLMLDGLSYNLKKLIVLSETFTLLWLSFVRPLYVPPSDRFTDKKFVEIIL